MSKWMELAIPLLEEITDKRHPTIASAPWTPRRGRMMKQMAREADQIEKVRNALLALDEWEESDKMPALLSGLRYRTQVEALVKWTDYPSGKDRDRLKKAGITERNFAEARSMLIAASDPVESTVEKIERRNEIERLVGKIPGFFYTPEPVAEQMLDLADLIGYKGRVLEPSAGAGHLADAITKRVDKSRIDICEISVTLKTILKQKGYGPAAASDFFDLEPNTDGTWGRIVMNPPFENLADIDHVRQAYRLLAPGGRLVSITSPSPWFRENSKAVEFREWLDDGAFSGELEYMTVSLPEGSFAETGTNVQAKILVIAKQDEPQQIEKEPEIDPSTEATLEAEEEAIAAGYEDPRDVPQGIRIGEWIQVPTTIVESEPRPRDREYMRIKGSVAQIGQLYPVIAIEKEDHWEVYDGHVRTQICRDLGIKVKILPASDEFEAERMRHVVTLAGNLRATNLMAEAEALERLDDDEYAKKAAGLTAGEIKARRRLLNLAPRFRKRLVEGDITKTAAKKLTKIPMQRQIDAWERAEAFAEEEDNPRGVVTRHVDRAVRQIKGELQPSFPKPEFQTPEHAPHSPDPIAVASLLSIYANSGDYTAAQQAALEAAAQVLDGTWEVHRGDD